MEQLTIFQRCSCPIEKKIFQANEYCFSVLARILDNTCTLTITDGTRLVICYSCAPYPVWIWLPDDATDEENERAYNVSKEHFGFCGGFRFNMKYATAEYFIRRAAKDGFSLSIDTNMLAYSCTSPVAPQKRAGGQLVTATEKDVEAATQMIAAFHKEAQIDELDVEAYRNKATAFISQRRFFFWQSETAENVACCSYHEADGKGSIGSVYTIPCMRRKGYAANMVYEVAKKILANGNIPCLYTDADYQASNACYTSVGFQLRGSLCTIK